MIGRMDTRFTALSAQSIKVKVTLAHLLEDTQDHIRLILPWFY